MTPYERNALTIRALFSHLWACITRKLPDDELENTLNELRDLRSIDSRLPPMTDVEMLDHAIQLFR